MAIPYRGSTGRYTYFVTANCLDKRHLLQGTASCRLLIDVLCTYQQKGEYMLHEFVIMPNHLHLMITPAKAPTLERCMQLIKGGYSYRRTRELEGKVSIWQSSFHDHRIRDVDEYVEYRDYLRLNPVNARFCSQPEQWPYSSASGGFHLDPTPPGLKPPASLRRDPQT